MSASFDISANATPSILTAAEVQNSMDKLKRIQSQPIPHKTKSEGDHTFGQNDAYLIELGEQLTKAWQHEEDVYAANKPDETFEQAFEKSNAIVDKIRDSSATTLDGLKVKTKAVLWCHGGESFAEALECETGDLKIVSTILDDLQNIGGSA